MGFLTNEKLLIVGAGGAIGSNMVQSALMLGLTPNVCLYDIIEPAVHGVAEEMCHCAFPGANVTWTTDPKEAFTGAKFIISSGGAPRKEGMTREDLLKGNCQIAAQFGDYIKQYCPDVKHVVVIFNPADVTALTALIHSGLKPNQLTSLAALDSTRLQEQIAKECGVLQSKVTDCYTYGGHGEQMAVFASKAKVENYKELGLNSETAVMFNITSKEQVIVNTWYGGEMKKGMFSMMNYYLPLKGIASMHCSANTDMNGENTAIFFGLSGTGKTTLSTDPKRLLIGDDEHGWDDNGVFNFEGGCYAKVINLDKESEPDIYNAIKRNALLENVTLDAEGHIDFADKSVTENTRVSYPIYHINNIKPGSSAPAAKQVIFLSADAFGVLPPVSILTPEQTKYYFLSGFTAKLAGTERGITEPTPTFSACFGQAFLELHPTKYAQELVKKMNKNNAKAYLVNTGWNGTGKRISIRDTRGIIDAILNGDIDKAPTKQIPMFDFKVPTELPGVATEILDPRDTYAEASQWEEKAKDLAARFIKNFAKFTGNEAGKALVAAGPQL